jgi:hypothetical protein
MSKQNIPNFGRIVNFPDLNTETAAMVLEATAYAYHATHLHLQAPGSGLRHASQEHGEP